VISSGFVLISVDQRPIVFAFCFDPRASALIRGQLFFFPAVILLFDQRLSPLISGRLSLLLVLIRVPPR
jgi:hypothetical protein